MNNYLWYIFIFITGILFKFNDDLIDLDIYPKSIIDKKKYFQILLIIFGLIIIIYNKHIALTLFLSFMAFYFIDIINNKDNLNHIYWFITGYFIFVITLYYLLYDTNDLLKPFYSYTNFIFLVLFGFLVYIEILIFNEETSIKKILSRIFVLFLLLFLIYNSFNHKKIFCDFIYDILIILSGYLIMSIFNLTYFYKDIKNS